jgi:hypothetical protein
MRRTPASIASAGTRRDGVARGQPHSYHGRRPPGPRLRRA